MAKHPGGRPKRYTQVFIEAQAEALLIYAKFCHDLKKPMFFQRFGVTQLIPSEYFSQWADKKNENFNEKFYKAYKIFKEWQEADLAEGALENRYDPGFAFRTLKNVAGWRDEQHLHGEGMASNIIQVVRNNESRTQKVSRRVRILRSPVSGNGSGMGNGKEPLRDSSDSASL